MKRIELKNSAPLLTIGITVLTLTMFLSSMMTDLLSVAVLLTLSLLLFVSRQDKPLFLSLFAAMFVASFSYELSEDVFVDLSPQEIKVAHLILNENNQVADLYQSIEHLEVDLLSVQTPVGLVDDPSFEQSTRNMPFVQRTICNDSMMIMVYSKNALSNLDTLCYNDAIAIVGDVIQQGSVNGIKVLSSLKTSHLNDVSDYNELNSYINKHCIDRPFLSLGVSNLDNTNLMTTEKGQVSNRRIPSALIPTFPISHSQKLRCVQVNSMKNGMGVIAKYQVI